MSEENKKDWERPWATEEIVEHADNWNLACDAALLNTLKAFGDKILKKAEVVNDKIENLNENLSKIHLQVDLARNEFSSLRNTQFVECRVYEDDETLPSEKPKDEEENNVPEEETIEDFREVVALGLEILDEFYDRVNVTVSDSEGEDEDGPSYVFRRKDPYINRRLPLVIGSEEWHKKWHVGLEDTDSENENSSEKLSDSESEDNFSQNKDHSDVSSELSNLSGLNNSKVRPVLVSTANTTQQDIPTSASGSDTSTEPTPKTLSFAEQLAAKLGNVIREKEETPVVEPEVNRRPIQKKHSDFGALFSNEPPPLDNMKEKESHGIFSGGKGLFDDEDDDDLWNPGETITSSAKQFSSGEKKTEEFDKLDQGKGIFDDDSDDGIFAPSKNYGTQQKKQPYLQSNKPAVPVFDEEPPLFEEDTNAKEKRKPAGGVSLFGKSDIFHGQNIGKILKQRKSSSSEDSNEDEPNFTPKPEKISSVTNENVQNKNSSKQTISSVPQRKDLQEKKKSMLFDDDIFGDDLFSSTAKSSSGLFEKSILFSDDDTVEQFPSRKSSVNDNTLKSNIKSDLFENSQSNDVLSPETPDTEYSFRKNSKSNIGLLFDDAKNHDDNTFMPKDNKQTPKKENYVKKEIKEKSYDEPINKKPILKLFDDDLEDVDDLFSGASKNKDDTKTQKPKSFLFDNDEEDDFNIFMTKSDNKSMVNKQKEGNVTKTEKTSTRKEELRERDQTNKSTKPKTSLFDDDLDDMDDLFSQFSKKYDTNENSKSEKSKNSGKTSELFSESQGSNATILANTNENTEDTNAKKNDEIKQLIKEKVSEELEKPKPQEKPATAPKSVIKTDSREKPVTAQKPVMKIDSVEKPVIVQKPDIQSDRMKKSITDKKPDISSSSEKEVTAKQPLIKHDQKEKDVITSNVVEIDPTEKSITTEKPFIEISNSNGNSSIGDVKSSDAPMENKIIKEVNEINEDSNNQKYPKENEYETVPRIPIIEKPKNIEENVDIFTNIPEDNSPPTMETGKYKTSPNVLNVNFMDSIPPPDDDWDTYSDNTFDDIEPGIDTFQSKPSSLFDSEPPSLFFDDTSSILKDPINDRLNSVSSPSQKKSPDVFSSNFFGSDNGEAEGNRKNDSKISDSLNIESDNNLNVKLGESESSTISKIGEESNRFQEEDSKRESKSLDKGNSSTEVSSETGKNGVVDKPKLLQKPKIKTKIDEHNAPNQDNINIKIPVSEDSLDTNYGSQTSSLFDLPATSDSIEKNSDFLFGDILDEDQIDFLSSKRKQTNYDGENFKISENIISDKSIKKNVSFDNVEQNEIRSDEPGGTDSDDNMQSNILKITEKLQQISNKNEERTKPLVIPRKLSHNLNINVGALLPGSALPKRERAQSPDNYEKLSKSLPASRFSLNEDFVPTKPIAIVRVSSEDTPTTKEYKLEKSVSFDGGTDVEVLQNITKDRARIPVKRRPSSRRARQKSLRDSISDFRLDDPIPDVEIPSESKEPVMVNKSAIEQIPQNKKSTVEPEQKNIEKDNLSIKSSENVKEEINVLESESEDLFKTVEKDIKNVNKANIISTKKKGLFDDEHELFGETSTEVTKKIDSLFHDDENDLFGNIKHTSKEKHESIEAVRSNSQDEPLNLPSEHKNKKLILANDNVETNERRIGNEFLRSVENYSESKNVPDKKPSTGRKTTIDNLFDSSDEDDIFKSTKVAVRETKGEKDYKGKGDSSISIIGRIAEKTDNTHIKVTSDKSKPDSLFDFSDDDDDFLENFASGKSDDKKKDKNNSEIPRSTSLFDDVDDDIFGTSSKENKTKQDVKPSVINKKPPKSTSLRKLGNIEGEEDPLSALLK